MEKDGYAVDTNELLSSVTITTWSELKNMMKVLAEHDINRKSHLSKALEELDNVAAVVEDGKTASTLSFLRSQLSMLFIAPNQYRFAKQTMMFAAELFGVSPAAYRKNRKMG